MDQKLYAQARKNVEGRRHKELIKEINDEYKRLLFESQKRRMSAKTLKEFRMLNRLAKETKIQNFMHSFMMHNIRISLDRIIKARKYHPSELSEYRELLNKKAAEK